MLKIIKRISRLLALVVVYVICAYGYLTAKGFVFTDGVPVLSNHAQAKEEEFAVKVNGNVKISGYIVLRWRTDQLNADADWIYRYTV